MQTLRSYKYVFTCMFILLLVLCSLLLSGWINGQLFQISRSARPLGSLPDNTPSQNSRTVTYRPGGHLIIPTIGINAPIEPVGVLADGNLAVPTQKPWEGVGWYRYGPYPGDQGSAVIDGHLDRPGGGAAVFWKLRNLHSGDSVMVVNPGEKLLQFRVLKMKYYTPDNAPLHAIFDNRTGTFLNLITCAGNWIPSQHQTTLRLVIYTVLVE
ncbi:MAG: class F sortase [Ktedonobacteraceae bacterium]|nr:class F sortase [Ktedonobacteraceae bacterium]